VQFGFLTTYGPNDARRSVWFLLKAAKTTESFFRTIDPKFGELTDQVKASRRLIMDNRGAHSSFELARARSFELMRARLSSARTVILTTTRWRPYEKSLFIFFVIELNCNWRLSFLFTSFSHRIHTFHHSPYHGIFCSWRRLGSDSQNAIIDPQIDVKSSKVLLSPSPNRSLFSFNIFQEIGASLLPGTLPITWTSTCRRGHWFSL